MYIPDDVWDRLNSEALDILDYLDSPKMKIEDLTPVLRAILFDIIHMQDKPPPDMEIEGLLKRIKFLLNIKRK